MGNYALSSLQTSDSWLGLQHWEDAVTGSQRLMLVDAGWQWPVWLPDGGAGRRGQGWITPEQGTRSAPGVNKSATVITHRQSSKGRDCFPIAQHTIFTEFVLVRFFLNIQNFLLFCSSPIVHQTIPPSRYFWVIESAVRSLQDTRMTNPAASISSIDQAMRCNQGT